MTRRAKRILLYCGESKVRDTMRPLRSSGFSAAESPLNTRIWANLLLSPRFFLFFSFLSLYELCVSMKDVLFGNAFFFYSFQRWLHARLCTWRLPRNVNDLEELDAGRVRINLWRDVSPWVMVGILKTLTRSNVKGEWNITRKGCRGIHVYARKSEKERERWNGREYTNVEPKEGGRPVAKWILIGRQHGHVRAVQLYDTAELLWCGENIAEFTTLLISIIRVYQQCVVVKTLKSILENRCQQLRSRSHYGSICFGREEPRRDQVGRVMARERRVTRKQIAAVIISG